MVAVSADAIQSVEQLALVWRMLVEDRGPADVRDPLGMAIRWADSKLRFINMLTLTEPGLDRAGLDMRLANVAAYMRARERPGALWLFEDLLAPEARDALPAAVDQAGLGLVLSGFGMVGDILPVAEPDHRGLQFVRVRTDADVEAFADVNSRAYGVPLEQGRDAFAGSRLMKSGMFAYLGLAAGVPVATAATVAAAGCLFVAFVATDPEHQRKGYGEAVTRMALYEGGKATGLRRATLHATAAGWRVYERIGFKRIATIGWYGLAGEAS